MKGYTWNMQYFLINENSKGQIIAFVKVNSSPYSYFKDYFTVAM